MVRDLATAVYAFVKMENRSEGPGRAHAVGMTKLALALKIDP